MSRGFLLVRPLTSTWRRFVYVVLVGGYWVMYGVRSWFIPPAPDLDRCIMGSSVHSATRCPRPTLGRLWCRKHYPGPGWWDYSDARRRPYRLNPEDRP